ncbi:hypothetical protein J008_02075 [Cryptococcus neoformans]|uniref:Beta-glucuronidase C-terminal domain-containing protein n=1 Tax=Cryptococcus neoformans (strain H99 / ATCC 208821 / CBS 10515 / FGSC 9487) TaxID=235443 RepID=J9VJ29_CRYN9|nr:hypothetical protein CNAG_04967 [Cryptococcus neoformans var. grubii H99]AUB23863.1 hypothetical protein CKF44_04967 [Cryptococcus neoformans var. grubii]OWZ33351.1 hypothetical protein C347_02371 [Cryptococcus neoformans var. grubii AD2-60a]OWZ45447.1 hypothetical protein C343_02303 [Cryptococcus neoformans var. grubii C23]OWZ78741.1 hypothetical protein C365_02379 [Cryptococcus neoformans var. grubii Bt85]OXC85508.1 hypothetical protein C344_02111 [Cryptococcus neoformans var. grubii AD1-|eukprot:XP_012048447.1 hypothetical protein CNAG_04967 [Cryptococcus neoformans var. grubii H99]
MLPTNTLFSVLLSLAVASAAVVPRDASASFDLNSGSGTAVKDPAPVAVSIEFFAFPGYVQDLDTTSQCLTNLDHAAGAATRVRIGGTTQDRATYDPTSSSAVNYYVADPADAPANLTYGPSFFDLASKLNGPTTIGLNRRLNNINNTIAAAEQAVKTMDNLYAIELGNEPDLYSSSDPIAGGESWTPALDAQIQVDWQKQVATSLNKKDIIQGGVFLQPPKFSIQELGPLEQSSGSIDYVKSWADHAYPQSACGGSKTNLEGLQNHTTIMNFVKGFQAEVTAAKSLGERPLFFGETNSATCGGGGISPTYGAALWLVDYVFQSVKLGYERLYFHQGTIGNSPYSWWGKSKVFAPYYGAYFAASALKDVTSISQVDDGSSHIAVYALNSQDCISKAVILNTFYYPNTTTTARSSEDITLTGLPKKVKSAKAKRLTAEYSTSQVELGQVPTFGGQTFDNESCHVQGSEQYETVEVNNGQATVSVAASEALLIYF